MLDLIKKIRITAKNTTTFRVGLLQTKAYRILKQHTSNVLNEFDISSVEWALLGILCDSEKGIRASNLAEELGVEASFITQTLQKLKGTGYIELRKDSNDLRAKILSLSDKGKRFVNTTEKHLKEETEPLLKDINLKDLISYLSVMQKIIDNDNSLK